jgi:hypothetical protein
VPHLKKITWWKPLIRVILSWTEQNCDQSLNVKARLLLYVTNYSALKVSSVGRNVFSHVSQSTIVFKAYFLSIYKRNQDRIMHQWMLHWNFKITSTHKSRLSIKANNPLYFTTLNTFVDGNRKALLYGTGPNM